VVKAALLGDGPVGVDASIFIYFIESHPSWREVVRPLFAAASEGRLELVTSALTLTEVLVIPYRNGDIATAERYEALITGSRNLKTVEVDRSILRGAAQLRAVTSVRTADAIHLASALRARCTSFITNDRRLPELRGLQIVQLSDLR
jgi:predicted nucleic acid-binding protein